MTARRSHTFQFMGQTLTLLPEKALFWVEQNMLIVSDVHAGKSGHFRKNGIAVPEAVNQMNLNRLDKLIQQTETDRILYLGDLFHSETNEEVSDFIRWRVHHSDIEMILTLGNHDVLQEHDYEGMQVKCVDSWTIGPFIFLHDPEDRDKHPSSLYPIAGHIHPSVRLTGKGRQKIQVPCFYFGQEYGLLPAFGTFTGNYPIKIARNEHIFALIEDQILELTLKN